ncbi:trypsin-like peptidase domain-containing protein [Marixanthomonas sp. SCSIO 43207]|uniref:trypsin-like peptidase domain-containing protein n=1 Tax=Marixanthomonas sp. SCSIO 43207 TaxID=2779360 RepID=UPI001CA88565|nr:trypsin-like peptidase domain-containing protein [Marixanthomonas sp. SCSIO 43207]UAB81188.1 trypsin-like peptidase domain-containing protein [Marixanthomonas sp. SCSIO 43207]
MKQTIKLITVALFAGAITLGGYKYFVEPDSEFVHSATQESPSFIPTNFPNTPVSSTNADFTEAAEKTVHAVVHVKNTTISRQPTNIMEYFNGGGRPREIVGAGSGVIISPDGYIITNNHVIANAAELEVTLNSNKIYKAELIGTDPKTDIALLKVDAEDDLPFIPFGDSNSIKIGEWVLAVGNPFNLNSTVTAGIISAKARDLNQFDRNPQSFIQTDAAVNRGNSGGALVNVRGELIGINTAITSETGSYVGYSFAVPSNNARKVIEDIMEYGNVQRAILGISGGSLNTKVAEELGIDETQGVYVASVEKGSGADKSGLKQGDVIKKLDGLSVSKFSDLSGYLGSKRPNDVVDVTILRNGREKHIPVTLVKLETFEIEDLGLEVRNANSALLKQRGVDNGVIVSKTLTKDMARYNLEGIIITKINDEKIDDIDDAKRIMTNRDYNAPIKMTFVNQRGELNSFIFR